MIRSNGRENKGLDGSEYVLSGLPRVARLIVSFQLFEHIIEKRLFVHESSVVTTIVRAYRQLVSMPGSIVILWVDDKVFKTDLAEIGTDAYVPWHISSNETDLSHGYQSDDQAALPANAVEPHLSTGIANRPWNTRKGPQTAVAAHVRALSTSV